MIRVSDHTWYQLSTSVHGCHCNEVVEDHAVDGILVWPAILVARPGHDLACDFPVWQLELGCFEGDDEVDEKADQLANGVHLVGLV